MLKTIIVVALFAFQSALAQASGLYITFNKLTGGDGVSYTLAVVRKVEPGQFAARHNQRLAARVLELANDWSTNWYLERYKHRPAEQFKAMQKAGVNLTDGSSFVVIYKSSDLTKPLGTLWAAYPDASGRMDLEDLLNWTYPRRATAPGAYESLNVVTGEVTARAEFSGGVVELKRLVLERNAPRELMTALLLRGEASDHLFRQPLGERDGKAVLPAEYALRCDPKLVPIYLRFGFKVVEPDPIDDNVIMKIDRASYVENAALWRAKAIDSGWHFQFEDPAAYLGRCQDLF